MDAMVLRDVYKIYKAGAIETVALRGANLHVPVGEFIAITGRSGAGKSTLLALMGGLATPSAGQIVVGDTDLARLNETERAVFRRQHIGIVYQTDNLVPFLSALENVMLPMQLAGGSQIAQRAAQLLEVVGLSERMQHKPAMLSGGERQRVAIAVALANNPQVLLADELTGELDSATAERIMDVLHRINQQQRLTLIVVTHNSSVASHAGRQIQVMDGQLMEQETHHG